MTKCAVRFLIRFTSTDFDAAGPGGSRSGQPQCAVASRCKNIFVGRQFDGGGGLRNRSARLLDHLVLAREQLTTLVRRVRPALDALGEYDRVVDELDRIGAQGNGAMRQLRAWRKRREVIDVIAEAAAATLS